MYGIINGMNSFKPKYQYVHDTILKDIVSGIITPGSFMPPEKHLMEQYNASRTTIRKAMDLLKQEGFVEIKQGRGTRVLFQNTKESDYGSQKSQLFKQISLSNLYLVETPFKTQSQAAEIDIVNVTKELSVTLSVPEDSEAFRFQRVKLIDNQVFGYIISFIPISFCPNIMKYNRQITNLYSALSSYYGLTIQKGIENISAINAGFMESRILDVKIGDPLLKMCRTGYLSGSKPIEYSESYLNPAIYQLSINMTGNMDSDYR